MTDSLGVNSADGPLAPGVRPSEGAGTPRFHDGPSESAPSASPGQVHVAAGAPASGLLDRLHDRDETTWTSVVQSHELRLRRLGHSYRLGRQEVEDALQRTWMSLMTHAAQIRDSRCLGAWLSSTMRNECLRPLRSPGRVREELVDDWASYEARCEGEDESDALPELLDRRELAMRIWEFVDHLPPSQRAVIRALYAQEDASYADVSARTGMPVGGIGPTRQRALRRLRELVDALNHPSPWTNAGPGRLTA
jgi:RNA polymerase sigma factor (sigma-70 family)